MSLAPYLAVAALLVSAVLLVGCPEPELDEYDEADSGYDDDGSSESPTTETNLAAPECLSIRKEYKEVIVLGPSRINSEYDVWTNKCDFPITIYYCQTEVLEWDGDERATITAPWRFDDKSIVCGNHWREGQPYYTKLWILDEPGDEHYVTVRSSVEALIGNPRNPPGDRTEWSVEYHYAVCRGYHRDHYRFSSTPDGRYTCR